MKRGLTQSATVTEDSTLKKQWIDGTIVYVAALASDMLDVNTSSGWSTISSDVSFAGQTSFGNVSIYGSLKGPYYANAVARDAAIPSPTNSQVAYLVAEGYWTDYIGGSWQQRANGATPNGSLTVAGKFQASTQAAADTPTDTGSTGALNVITPSIFQQGMTNRKASVSDVTTETNDTKFVTPLSLAGKTATNAEALA